MGLKTYMLTLTGAIVVDGDIVRKGSLVELVEDEAKKLLARGKAVLADVEQVTGRKTKPVGGATVEPPDAGAIPADTSFSDAKTAAGK